MASRTRDATVFALLAVFDTARTQSQFLPLTTQPLNALKIPIYFYP